MTLNAPPPAGLLAPFQRLQAAARADPLPPWPARADRLHRQALKWLLH